jgi:2-octaprenyl-6-methoxyphenol hydroxylase
VILGRGLFHLSCAGVTGWLAFAGITTGVRRFGPAGDVLLKGHRILSAPPYHRSDVLIAGGGFAGFALAIALRQALGENFVVTLADPGLGRTGDDIRASAIAAAPRRMFETLGVWGAVAGEAQPVLDMAITDSRVDDAVRPVFLTFGGEIEPGEPFAHMVENGGLIAALAARAVSIGVVLVKSSVADFAVESSGVNAVLSDGTAIRTGLLVAADGARSRLRERAGIATIGWSYGQSAIVTTVAHERSHEGRAEAHFLPPGPFAVLPLSHNRSSIVWTEEAGEAERIVALPDDDFHDELEKRFGLRLGDIAVAGPRRAYPLGLWVARSFISDRLALIGDAAHVIHPIAGQGMNMGLRDVAALAEAVVDAVRLGLDPGDTEVLARYQRWRRFDTMTMCFSTDSLNRIFSNRSDAMRLVRDLGLGVVERLPALKGLFIREAAGLVGDVPKLLRGESLS